MSFRAMDILSSGLQAQRLRLEVTAENLANAHTTRTPEGGPYLRKDPVFEAVLADAGTEGAGLDGSGPGLHKVQVADVVRDSSNVVTVHDPSHPDADPVTGNVRLPNVNVVHEMVNMMTASRSYEANATAFETLKQMANKAIDLGR